jgi:hypothetical protein
MSIVTPTKGKFKNENNTVNFLRIQITFVADDVVEFVSRFGKVERVRHAVASARFHAKSKTSHWFIVCLLQFLQARRGAISLQQTESELVREREREETMRIEICVLKTKFLSFAFVDAIETPLLVQSQHSLLQFPFLLWKKLQIAPTVMEHFRIKRKSKGSRNIEIDGYWQMNGQMNLIWDPLFEFQQHANEQISTSMESANNHRWFNSTCACRSTTACQDVE